MFSCKACYSTASRQFVAREMMFGLRESFDYSECADCGTLQISTVPADLGRYYPKDYYAFRPTEPRNPIRRFLRPRWSAHLIGDHDTIGALLAERRPPRTELLALREPRVSRSASILDVGSGASGFLERLADLGFTNLLGIDPFLNEPVIQRSAIRRLRASIDQMDGRFDVIFFNHSLEHIHDPVGALVRAACLLSPEGRIVVRTPIANRTWRERGVNWVELDAPRHLVVFSERGVQHATGRAGLSVVSARYDTTAFELWGTRLYELDIPLKDPRRSSLFTRAELAAFEREAQRMNMEGSAGRACFVLSSS